MSDSSSSSSNHDDNDVDNKINNDDDDGASFSNRMKNLKLNPDVLKARSNQVEDPEKIKERGMNFEILLFISLFVCLFSLIFMFCKIFQF